MVWFAPGEPVFAARSRPRPAPSAARWSRIPPEEANFHMNVDPDEEPSASRRTQPGLAQPPRLRVSVWADAPRLRV